MTGNLRADSLGRLFLDLDGVLADFDSHVYALFGRRTSQLPPPVLWGKAAKAPGFFTTMPMMADADHLWRYCEPFEPAIITGLPRGNWAAPQKREWVAANLGRDVDVITCMARDKWRFAAPGAVLVDDNPRYADLWEAQGGIFVVHTSAESTIAELERLGYRQA